MKKVFSINNGKHGRGPIKFQWQKKLSHFLAVVGVSNVVHIYDKNNGEVVDTFTLAGNCNGMEWSTDGEILAVIQDKTGTIYFWDTYTRKLEQQVETNLKQLNSLKWSLKGDILSVGTAKGNLLLYDRKSGKKIPIMGKHTRSIICQCWSGEDMLACGSEDSTFTITNTDGDTVFQMGLKGEPSLMQWSYMRGAKNSMDPVMSMVLGSKTLFFYNPANPTAPIELAFQSRYGSIIAYQWFGEGFIMIGFSSGYLVVISTKLEEIGQELFQSRDFKDYLSDVAISFPLSKAASCGDTSVKVHDMNDLNDIWAIIPLEDERGKLDRVGWSEDGQFMTICTKEGSISSFLAKLPTVNAYCGPYVAFLSQLKEITISDQSKVDIKNSNTIANDAIKKEIDIDPSVIGLGPNHFVVCLDNHAWYYTSKGSSSSSSNNPAAPSSTNSNPVAGKRARPTTASRMSTGARSGGPNSAANDLVLQKDYPAGIVSINMNYNYAAVLLEDGKLHLHLIDQNSAADKGGGTKSSAVKIFPDKEGGNDMRITCVAITNDFLVYGTSDGLIHHSTLGDWVVINSNKHKFGIKSISLNYKGGTKFIFQDDKGDGYLCNPSTEMTIKIGSISAKTIGALWNYSSQQQQQTSAHRSIFVSWDANLITTTYFQQYSTRGPQLNTLGVTRLPYGLQPVLIVDGIATVQTPSGKLVLIPLSTPDQQSSKDTIQRSGGPIFLPATYEDVLNLAEPEQTKLLQTYYAMGSLKDIWNMINFIKSTKPWMALAETALNALDIVTAKRIYRQIIGNVGMVLTLDDMDWIDDINLIAGHVASLLGNVTLAQDFLLKSSNPMAILELRRDLMNWEQALTLAQTLAPEEVTLIAKDYAQQLEFDGKFTEALAMYEQGLSTSNQHPGPDELMVDHQIACSAGMTRMTCRLGDVARGMKMLSDCTEKPLLSDCASILDNLKQYTEAGVLFERAEKWEKAAESYSKAKNWNKVGNLLPLVTNSKIIIQYAKTKEADRQFLDAAKAYEKARDYENLVRIYIDHLKRVDEVVEIVRKTRSRESAKLVSKFFQSIKDYKSVVEFCLMAGMNQEAFDVATQHDVMEHYAELVKDETSTDMLINISIYFEEKRQFMLAGKYLQHAGIYPKALRMFLAAASSDPVAVDYAIETVGMAGSDSLTHELIDFLMGERDGIAKDAKYIFKLHMSLKQYREAARTAIIIAREEQMLGNYRAAHDLLLDNYQQLRKMKVKVPSELSRMLMLLHSYILVKILIRMEDHEQAAQMLIRVSNSISKFPAHVVPILTSTVIECQRSGLKRYSFEFASMLVRPEYRSKLDSKYKRKIEQIVRRPEKDERDEDFKTQCPFCSTLVPDNVLDCLECKNHIPYCIASGKHMILQDWSYCPRCEFPALHSRMKSVLESTGQCPMCSQNVDASSLTLVDDPTELLKGRKESEKDDDGGGDADEQKQIIVSDAAAANADSPATAQQLEGKVRSVPVPSSMGF